MHPWTLKAGTPVGAATLTISFSRAFILKNDLPVPAVPEMTCAVVQLHCH